MQLNTAPFQLPMPSRYRWLASAGERLLGLNQLDSYYQQRQKNMNSRDFLRYTLNRLGVDYTISSGSYDSIPRQGPCVIVANHPFGAIEGVMLAELLLKHRSDVKVLANEFLHRINEIAELFIGVDVFENASSTQKNARGIKQAVKHLKNDGLLLVFPAGEVSSLQLKNRKITDRKWNRIIAMMIRKTGASTTPVYIEGNNSKLFHLAGLLHPRMRTLMLVREMLNKRKQKIKLHIGQNIAFTELKSLSCDEAITNYLRMNTYLLASQVQNLYAIKKSPPHEMKSIVAPIDRHLLQLDVDNLSPQYLLIDKGDMTVYCAGAEKLPNILNEIGRLRELTFRQVGEGTGKESDLDNYDRNYLHIFIWNREKQEIAGAYRLGLVDQLIKKQGINGLYSRSLFQYDQSFLSSLGSCIEMGRSFIHPDYQRSLNTLLLLWKGIATYASNNPQYTTLFGPVSISSDYSELSRSLMASFLQLHHYDNKRAEMLHAKNPYISIKDTFWSNSMLSEVNSNQLISKLIYRMEGDKGLPVLLRQYLGLNGKLVCFNVDKDFNDALDGMIIVDLLKVPEKMLSKYMGKEQAEIFKIRTYTASENQT
ncbi:Putative hemolysin [hydrothermal vent metagenome]|uniref:Hemolysin n=1 Tax=hydrothermal vent metagenome TaxID=652676 RepID=A0A3B0X1T9_9ZZZZ